MDQPNLTVLTDALVTRVTFRGKRATGVEIFYGGAIYRVGAAVEVVLSLGAIQTPKVLMQSGIGDQADLQRLGIQVVQHLPALAAIFRIMLRSIVSGNIKLRWHRGITCRKPFFSPPAG